jgi:hypothetical protein
MRTIINPGETLTAVMSGAAATTNPAVMTDYLDEGNHQTSTTLTALNGATAVTLLAPTTARNVVNCVQCYNVDTAAVTVAIKRKVGATTFTLAQVTLISGDHLELDALGMRIIDTNGNLRQTVNSPYVPSSALAQFGAGVGTFGLEGNIYSYADGTGLQVAVTGADKVVAVYSLPANSLDGIRFRGLLCQFSGNKANNASAITAKIIFNATTAVVGATVTGGTTIATTGATTTSGGVGWGIEGQVYKYGIANSNTQITQEVSTVVGTTHGGMGLAATAAAVENAPILIAFTINAATTATDATAFFASVNSLN